MKKKAETELLNYDPTITNFSGIYILTRTDENGVRFAYIGQAKHLRDRLVSHMMGYSQRIDISLRKRGLYSVSNKYGWDIENFVCAESELNDKEQEFIREYLNKGYQMYNKTLGSQGEGKISIDDHSTKGYFDGVKYGYEKCRKEITELFDKYLDFSIKSTCIKKNGEFTEIGKKKFNEFVELLKGGNNGQQD